jgi:lambda repressor-like predicted transcriptional regulator
LAKTTRKKAKTRIKVATLDEPLQKRLASLVMMGCTLRTAARVAGIAPQRLRKVLLHDPKLSERLLVAEAICEFTNLERLRDAAKDSKNWRIVVWFLERRFPYRYMPRPFSGVSATQMQTTLKSIGEEIAKQFTAPSDRERIIAALGDLQRDLALPSTANAEDA